MNKSILYSLVTVIILTVSGCAQRYYAIEPSRFVYTTSNDTGAITLNYKYDVVHERKNTKMWKKEMKYNIKLVAVKITNNTDKVVSIGNNIAFYNGSSQVYPIDQIAVKDYLKQSVPSHLWYLLLSPITLTINGSSPIPIGLILGPGISLGNMLVASNANKKFSNELIQYDIINKEINPGETVYGLVGFRNLEYGTLSLKLIKK